MRTCKQCGQEFLPKSKGRPPLYCSPQCGEKARKPSELRKETQRAAGKRHYQRNKGKILEKNRAWITAHPDKPRAYTAAYRERHPERKEKDRLLGKQYREINREEILEYKRAYRKDNKGKEREYAKANRENINKISREWQTKYREENREDHRRKQKEHRERNPHVYTAKYHRRRTRKTDAGGSYSRQEWIELLDKYSNRCLCCGRNDLKLTVDHVIPVSLGGTSNIDNLQPLCQKCNSSKNNKVIDYRTQWKEAV